MNTIQVVKGTQELHVNIAGDVWPSGATLTCRECGVGRNVSAENCGHYLRHGWPKCCGYTMRMDTPDAT